MAKSKDPLVGASLGEYKIQKMVGKGGMSRVYLAEDEHLSRDVAIKVITLDPERAKELMKRFEREAKTIGKLDRHPNIIRVHRYGTEGETRYLAMEFIHGTTLSQRMAYYKNKGEYMPNDELIRIMQQVASALDYAHQNHVIHRDIKPSNIMLEEDSNRAVLMDFGLVMQSNTETTLGTAFGTPRYISPEQAISSQQAVPQSDIYSLAVIVYECLAGQAPFEDDSAMSLALSHITNPAPDPRDFRDSLPTAVSKVLLKALEKSPQDRYQTTMEMIKALAQALNVPLAATTFMPTATGIMPVVEAVAELEKENDSDTERGAPTTDVPPAQPVGEMSPSGRRSRGLRFPATGNSWAWKPPVQLSGRSRKLRFALIILVIIALMAGAVLIFGSGDNGSSDGDNNRGQGNNSGAASNSNPTASPTPMLSDMLLQYSNDYMTVYNRSSRNLDIRGMEFVLPNGEQRFISGNFGASLLENFEPGWCVHIYLSSLEVDPPSFCTEDKTRLFIYNNQTSDRQLYWVWLRGVGNPQFRVVLDSDIIATCSTERNRCGFDIPR